MAAALLAYGVPAYAQEEIRLLRDTETEEMLRSYEAPLARAAGLDPSPKVWLVQGPINAFASYGDGGENIFIFSGILLWLQVTQRDDRGDGARDRPYFGRPSVARQLWHEEGDDPHAALHGGGAGRDDRGRRRSRHGHHGHRPGLCHGPDGGLHAGAGIHRRPDRRQASAGDASVADGHVPHLPALRGRRGDERLQDRQVRRGPSVGPGPRLRSQRHGARLRPIAKCRTRRKRCTPSRWCRPSSPATCCR